MWLGRNLRFFLLIPLLIASGVHGDSDNDTGDVTDTNDVGVEAIFSPSVSATCRAGLMTIKVETNNNFQGAVHARDFRRPACTNYGEATTTTTLNINLLAERDTDKYCGVFVNKQWRTDLALALHLEAFKALVSTPNTGWGESELVHPILAVTSRSQTIWTSTLQSWKMLSTPGVKGWSPSSSRRLKDVMRLPLGPEKHFVTLPCLKMNADVKRSWCLGGCSWRASWSLPRTWLNVSIMTPRNWCTTAQDLQVGEFPLISHRYTRRVRKG